MFDDVQRMNEISFAKIDQSESMKSIFCRYAGSSPSPRGNASVLKPEGAEAWKSEWTEAASVDSTGACRAAWLLEKNKKEEASIYEASS